MAKALINTDTKISLDALSYATIDNQVNDNASLTDFAAKMGISSSDSTTINSDLNSKLLYTTIKRACCMGKTGPPNTDGSTGIKVKIPIPKDYNIKANADGPFTSSYGYIEKTVYVPTGFCSQLGDTYTKDSKSCDNFMELYCQNQIKNLSDTGTYSQTILAQYLPECACYGKVNPAFDNLNIPATCYQSGCKIGLDDVYLDPSSRGAVCNATVCLAIVNAENITAGHDVTISPQITQNCGPELKEAEDKAAAKAKTDAAAAAAAAAAKATADAAAAAAAAAAAEAEAEANARKPKPFVFNKKMIIFVIICCLLLCASAVFGVYLYRKRHLKKIIPKILPK
jgi:hypothetical protein